jgi:hypothetical protein
MSFYLLWLGTELQIIARMGCDAATFGNHGFDLGLTRWRSDVIGRLPAKPQQIRRLKKKDRLVRRSPKIP